MCTTKTVKVTDLRDPYFGRIITHDGDEIAKVFAHYCEDSHWSEFMSGRSSTVKVRVKEILLDAHAGCYIKMEADSDIPFDCWPYPADLIYKHYLCSWNDNSIPEKFVKRITM